MVNRDLDSVKRDMTECIKQVASAFKGSNIPLEAGPIAELSKTMFDDYRGNSTRDVAEHMSDANKELLTLQHSLDKDK